MPRSGFKNTPFIIMDGNSLIQQGYDQSKFAEAFNDEYGSGNYEIVKAAVGGQHVDDMQGRLAAHVIPFLSHHRTCIYVNQPGRNQLKLTADSNATVVSKIKTLYQTVQGKLSDVKNILVLTSASVLGSGDFTIMTDIPLVNDLLEADVSGDFDQIYDLYNDGGGFDDGSNKPPFQSDEVHYSNPTGMETHADWIANKIKTSYP